MVEDLGDPGTAIHGPALATADDLGARYARLIVAPGTWGTSFDWDAKVTPFAQDAIQHQMRPYMTLGNGGSPPSPAVYGSWCGEAASRYDGQGSHPLVLDYSAWNEPNLNGIPGATYRSLYRACRSAIKAVLPSANVYFGEIEAGGTDGCTFLDSALPDPPSASDPAIVTEGLSIHPYQYATDPRTAMPSPCQGIGNLPGWTSALASAVSAGRINAPGGGSPALLVSEFGYCTDRTPASPDNPYTSSSAIAACPQTASGVADKLDDVTRASWTGAAYRWAQANDVAIFDYHGIAKRPAGDFVGNPGGVLWESGLIENPSGAQTPSVAALRLAVATPTLTGSSPAGWWP